MLISLQRALGLFDCYWRLNFKITHFQSRYLFKLTINVKLDKNFLDRSVKNRSVQIDLAKNHNQVLENHPATR